LGVSLQDSSSVSFFGLVAGELDTARVVRPVLERACVNLP